MTILSLAVPTALVAQAPVVVSVEPWAGIRSADDRSLSPGDFASVVAAFGLYGSGAVTVLVGGRQTAILNPWDYGDVFLIQIPVELAPGPTTVMVSFNGANSPPYDITLERYSPTFIFPNQRQSTFERPLPDGAFAPASCSVGQTAKPGEIVRAYAVGLGATDPLVPTGSTAAAAPLSRTTEKPRVLLGDQSVEVLESVLVPGEIGLYRVTFKLPPEILEGLYLVTLAIGDKYAHPALLGVGKAINFTTLPATPALGVTGPSSPESIVRAQACGFSFGNASGGSTGDAVIVTVRDSEGVVRPSLLPSASPDSLDFIVPAGTANGDARVTIMTAEGTVWTGKLEIQNIAPRIFLSIAPSILPLGLSAGPVYPPAGVIIRLRGGVQTVEPLSWTSMPIDLGPEGDQVFLILFGTGWRGRNSLANTGLFFTSGRANPGGLPTDVNTVHVPAEFAGPQGAFDGLDQMNVRLPRSLAGRVILEGGFEVDGKSAVVPFLKWMTFK